VIQRLMGHADIATTMRYVTVSADQMDAAIAAVFGNSGQQVANRTGAKPPASAISDEK